MLGDSFVLADGRGGGCEALEQQRAERHRAEHERRQLVQRGGREAKMRTQMDLAKKRAKKAREIWLGRVVTTFYHDKVKKMRFEEGLDVNT